MSGSASIALGGVLLLLGGVAGARLSVRQAGERRALEGRLKEIQFHQGDVVERGFTAALPRDLPRWLGIALARADIVARAEPILFGFAGAVLVALLALALFGWLPAIIVAAVESVGSVLALRFVAQRRIGRFVNDLPFLLDTVRQMLTTGSSVQQALTRAAESAGPGTQRYLLPMVRRIQNGAAVGDSATWLAERLDVLELHMFATAIQTNVRYGGRLSVVLSNLIEVLRDRARVIRELKAATAETRMSAIVLGALPAGTAVFITLSNPSYTKFFLETAQGHQLILISVALQSMGIMAMRWLMRLDY